MEEKILPKLLVSRKKAEEKIQAQIEEGQQLRDLPIDSWDEYESVVKKAVKWSSYNVDLLVKLFESSELIEGYEHYIYVELDRDDFDYLHSENYVKNVDDYVLYKSNKYKKDLTDRINCLEGIRDRLELFEEPESPKRIFGDKIFIVHGHDEGAKHKVARFVADLALTETILDEQPGKGQTMIDKFEEHADEAGFAIILLTADDIGAPKEHKDNLQPRARQNVILELGYFIALLGRERVCVLYEKDVELPSDIQGLSYLSYVPMNNDEGWKLKLAREMKNIGIPINSEKLL